MVIEEYDGLISHVSILMDKLYSWVSSLDISKALEKDRYIKNVASVACTYILKDEKLFTATEQIRFRVSHVINHPFYLENTVKIIAGVVENISFQFENLIGVCKHCDMILHEDGICFKVREQTLTLALQRQCFWHPSRQPV